MVTRFGATTSAAEVAGRIDLSGETIAITGGSAGLGVETIRVLSARGARIVSIVRDEDKGQASAATIRESVPEADIEVVVLDLFDLDSVRRLRGLRCRQGDRRRSPVVIGTGADHAPPS